MNKQVLTTNDVTIRQVEVSIQVLKIGPKQMTQAVFKQLPEEPIINRNTGELQGEAWGRVNYHVDCDGLDRKHMHIVWQTGSELRRCAVTLPWLINQPFRISREWFSLHCKYCCAGEAFIASRILEGWDAGHCLGSSLAFTLREDLSIREGDEDVFLINDLSSEIQKAGWMYTPSGRRTLVNQSGLIDLLTKQGVSTQSSEEIAQNLLIPAQQRLRQCRQKWEHLYDQLQQLDQLFIAV